MKKKPIYGNKKNVLSVLTAMVLSVLTAMIVSIGCVLPVGAEGEPSANFTVAALSQYIWRGQELSRDSIVIQPSATVSYADFAANLWGNIDADPYIETPGDTGSQWNETDLTLSYGKRFDSWSVEGGYIYYGLEALEDSQEVFLSLSYDTLLAPTLTVYRDFDSYEHWYFLLCLSHTFQIAEAVSLELSASASHLKSEDDEAYPEINDQGMPTGEKFGDFHDGVISATLPIPVSEHMTVTPLLLYTFPLSSDASDEMQWRSLDGDNDSFLYGGIIVSFAF